MDLKGHFATTAGHCQPLTVLDDHSRFNLAAQPLENRMRLSRVLARSSTGILQNPHLHSDITVMDTLLHFGAGLDLNQIPALCGALQHIGADQHVLV